MQKVFHLARVRHKLISLNYNFDSHCESVSEFSVQQLSITKIVKGFVLSYLAY